jgi:type IV pilus assembly protein PilY1
MMNSRTFKTIIKSCGGACLLASQTLFAVPLSLHYAPLYLSNAEKANVLVILDNSNSMDEAANGSAVGSDSPDSKSEIARTAIKSLINNYTGKINMGLMAYQQPTNYLYRLDNSPYDISFNPANYDPAFTGDRESSTKRFQSEKTDDLGNYVYYNVALPYYHPNNDNATMYCWSNTVVGLTGTPVNYRCFRHKTGSSDTQADAAGYNTWINSYTFGPTDSDDAQGITSFGTRMSSYYVGRTWFANSSPGRGYLHTPISELDTTQAGKLNSKLATSQFTNNGPTNPTLPLQNAGQTPLEGTLLSAKDYFTGTTLPADEGGPASSLPESCGKDFIALLTDGLPSFDATGEKVTSPEAGLNAVTSVAGALNSAGVETYMIGFSLPVGTDQTTLDTVASAGGTDTAYMANDPATLQTSFDTIFSDILAKTGASSSAATNSASLSTTSYVYQARFNSGDWSGELLAKSIDINGAINNSSPLNAATLLNSKAANDRVILTYNRDNQDGMPFRWSSINGLTDTTAKDALNFNALTSVADGLGPDRVDFIRGGTGNSSASDFRTDRTGKLGDIVHSTPYYVGTPNAGYNELEHAGYNTFRKAHLSRSPMIYTGANDGMLHGFDALSLEEVFAYIPSKVYSNLSRLTGKGYGSSTLSHRYTVDGSPMVADADVNGWKTILAGGLNAGGQGIYALDVTNPPSITETSASAIDTLLWEFTDETDADLGYTYVNSVNNTLTGQSSLIAKMSNDKWAVILGNGYNNTEADGHASTTGHAYLYVLFIEEGMDGTWTLGTDYIKIDTGAGSTSTPNGLATPTPIDSDGDGDIDFIYAGDLEGNMWKFDVSDTNTSQWKNKLSGKKPLFTAKDASNNLQSITSAPLVTRHPEGGYMIGFGTGKYLEISDLSITDTHTIYGIWDQNSNVSSRSSLVEQTVLTIVSKDDTRVSPTITNKYRITSQNTVDYSSGNGWFMDLPESGERVDVNPIIRDGRFVFVTRTPSTTQCDSGGTSWLMEFDYLTGGRLDISPFDYNNDGVINSADYVTITVTIDGEEVTITVPTTGFQSGIDGMISSPIIVKDPEKSDEEHKVSARSDGSIGSILESAQDDYSGRISWEEIR